MPARSNDFQRLVYLVKKLLARSATVTESKPLRHRRTNDFREMDICIQLAVISQNTNAPAAIWIVTLETAGLSYRKLTQLPNGPRIRGLAWTRDGSACGGRSRS